MVPQGLARVVVCFMVVRCVLRATDQPWSLELELASVSESLNSNIVVRRNVFGRNVDQMIKSVRRAAHSHASAAVADGRGVGPE